MDIGVFDHLDQGDVPLDEFYESRLRLLEKAVSGGLRVPGADTIMACAAITVSVEYPEASHGVRAETLPERRGEG